MCTLNRYFSFQLAKACEEHDVSQCFMYIKSVCVGTMLGNFLSCLLLKTQGMGKDTLELALMEHSWVKTTVVCCIKYSNKRCGL